MNVWRDRVVAFSLGLVALGMVGAVWTLFSSK
jgi:hypothetical protein